MWALPGSFRLYSKKSLLKSSNAKKYLPNFPTPKNPEINNYKPKVGYRVTSLEIKSILPPPLPWDFYDGQVNAIDSLGFKIIYKDDIVRCNIFQLHDNEFCLFITYFRATLISRIYDRNNSRDLNFAILTNHCFSR